MRTADIYFLEKQRHICIEPTLTLSVTYIEWVAPMLTFIEGWKACYNLALYIINLIFTSILWLQTYKRRIEKYNIIYYL